MGKAFGPIVALEGINLTVRAGEVACVLGDNGAGKSTLIKIISGLHPHTSGTLKVDGQDVKFGSPRDSLDHGIATVYQDLAVVGLMEVWRNFFLGSELRKGNYPLAPMDIAGMRGIADERAQEDGHQRQGHQPAHRHACPAGSASAWPSPAPSTSAPGC